MGALERMAARVGASPADVAVARAMSSWNEGMRRVLAPVPDTPELRRVVGLPRRQWETLQDLEWLAGELTDWLKTPGGEQRLRLVQAAALGDLHDHSGLFAPLRVGSGKTLITRLAPLVCAAQRPLLLIPAKLRDKTYREFRDLNAHWKRHPTLSIVSYEKISHINGAALLEKHQPDMVIMDECHRVKNRNAAVTRRVERYLEAHPEVIVVALSGTITKRSILDFHHIMRWTHTPANLPMPITYDEASLWARSVDPNVPEEKRPQPGALVLLLDDGKEPTVENLREAFGRRLVESPSVVSTTSAGIDCPIILDVWDPELPSEIRELIYDMVVTGETKTGDVIQSEMELARHVREMVLGFYYRWDPPAPLHWLMPRRAWNAFVRETLDKHIDGLDSPLQVARAVSTGRLDSNGTYEAWCAVRDDFVPNSVPVWITSSILEDIVKRVEEMGGPTIVWVEHVAVGEKLSEMTGWRYFGEGGLDKSKKPIEEVNGTETVIASLRASGEGRNLQAWSRSFYTTCMGDGQQWEQSLGRIHREGQEADEVQILVRLGHSTLRAAFSKAFDEARFLEQVQGQPQKLLLADLTGTL